MLKWDHVAQAFHARQGDSRENRTRISLGCLIDPAAPKHPDDCSAAPFLFGRGDVLALLETYWVFRARRRMAQRIECHNCRCSATSIIAKCEASNATKRNASRRCASARMRASVHND